MLRLNVHEQLTLQKFDDALGGAGTGAADDTLVVKPVTLAAKALAAAAVVGVVACMLYFILAFALAADAA